MDVRDFAKLFPNARKEWRPCPHCERRILVVLSDFEPGQSAVAHELPLCASFLDFAREDERP